MATMAKRRARKKAKAEGEKDRPAAGEPDHGSDASKGGKGKAPKKENALVEWAKSLLIALLLFFFITTFLIKTFVIISGSMEDTLLVGDLLLVNRAAVGSKVPGTSFRIPGYSQPERGQIFVLDPPHEEELMLVKRMMGLPGDTLEMRDKVLFVNGEPLEEPYVRTIDAGDHADPAMAWQEDIVLRDPSDQPYRPTRDNWGPLVIPPGRYFMMGDNRDESLDSRYWGLVERWRLVGRPFLVYFSYERESYRPFAWLTRIRWGRIGHRVR